MRSFYGEKTRYEPPPSPKETDPLLKSPPLNRYPLPSSQKSLNCGHSPNSWEADYQNGRGNTPAKSMDSPASRHAGISITPRSSRNARTAKNPSLPISTLPV